MPVRGRRGPIGGTGRGGSMERNEELWIRLARGFPLVSRPASRGARLAEAGLLAAQLGFLVWTRLLQPTVYSDDAYIHFENARHLARGEGLVFNVGQYVLATTSPVYAVLLGLLHAATRIELPSLATIVNFAADAGLLLLTLGWLKRAEVPLLFRHAALLILSSEVLRMFYSVAGMEMSLFLLISLTVCDGLGRGSWLAPGALLGALGWVRPEGVVVWGAAGLALAVERRWRQARRLFAVALATAALLAGALMLQYGTLIPQSLRAKAEAPWFREAGGLAPVEFFIRLGDLTPFYPLHGFRASWGRMADQINSSAVAGAQIVLMAVGAAYLGRRGLRGTASFLAAFAIGYYLFYALANPQIFPWYYIPHFFASLLLGAMGWWSCLETLLRRLKPLGRAGPLLARTSYIVGTGVLLGLSIWTTSRPALLRTAFPERPGWRGLAFRFEPPPPTERESRYADVAELMNVWIGPRTHWRVGLVEIGIFGYHFNGAVLDTFGLASPEALLAARPETAAGLDPDCRHLHPINVLVALRPEFVLSHQRWIPITPPCFLSLYRELRLPSIGLRLFVRRNVAPEIDVPSEWWYDPPV